MNHIQRILFFPKCEVKIVRRKRKEIYSRVDDINRSWKNLKSSAGVTNMQVKDLRTFFNWVLINKYYFSHKDAGAYIGNSEEVN